MTNEEKRRLRCEDELFTDLGRELCRRRGEEALAILAQGESDGVTVSDALTQRCEDTIRHAVRRRRTQRIRRTVLLAAALTALLLTVAYGAFPVVRRTVNGFLITRTVRETEYRYTVQDGAPGQPTEPSQPEETEVTFGASYAIRFGYLPELPLTEERSLSFGHICCFGNDDAILRVSLLSMTGAAMGVDSEGAVITELTVSGRPAELYDHGDRAILVILWEDNVVLNLTCEGLPEPAAEVQRVAEGLTVARMKEEQS